jgi:hypothetical protein
MEWVRDHWYYFFFFLPLAMFGVPCGNCMASCSGYDTVITRTLSSCPAAVAMLGPGISLKVHGLSCACGQEETGGGTGHAAWQFQVAGSKANGTLDATLEQHGGSWTVTSGALTVGDRSLDLTQCHGANTPSDGWFGSGNFDGRVNSVQGLPPVPHGAVCSGDFARHRGQTDALITLRCSRTPGQVEQQKGEQPAPALYGARASISGNAQGTDLVIEDSRTTAEDGTPALRFDLRAKRVTVRDSSDGGGWSFVVDL